MSRLAATIPPLSATPEMLAQARENCAARLRARGHALEAEAFAAGERDFAWAVRHEVTKLKAEAERG
jgi:hypothetical protein